MFLGMSNESGCGGKIFIGIIILIIIGSVFGNNSDSDNNKNKEKTTDKSVSQVVEANEEIVSTTTKKEEIEIEYADKELKINYPRPKDGTILRKGDEGDDVGWLQSALSKAMNYSMTIDCSYNNFTESNVIEFQERCGLSADGIAGKQTIDRLVEICSGKKSMPPAVRPPKTQPPVAQDPPPAVKTPVQQSAVTYVLNTKTMKFHLYGCYTISSMNDENKSEFTGTKSELYDMGYTACAKCNP